MHTQENINTLAEIIRLIYEQDHKSLDIPFFKHFPENCCEGASFFFGYIAQEMFPDKTIEIIKGRRVRSGHIEYHYWIECQNQIFDLTADQFKNINAPAYGISLHQKHLGFKEIQREFISCHLLYYIENCVEAERLFLIKNTIVNKIQGYRQTLLSTE